MTPGQIRQMALHLGVADPLEEEREEDPRDFAPLAPRSESFFFLVAVGVTVSVISHLIFASMMRRVVRRAVREDSLE